MLSKVAHSFEAYSKETSMPAVVVETVKCMMDHAKTCGLVNNLCLCLATAGTSLAAGSSNLLRAACEGCKALWSLIEVLEILSTKRHAYLFPLDAMYTSSLSRLEIKEDEIGMLIGKDSTEVVDAFSRAFLKSKAMQVSIYYCVHQRLDAAVSAGLQVSIIVHVLRTFICIENFWTINC